VFADADGRKLYVPRGGEVLVFDLDSLKPAGTIANARARGAAVDPKSHHGFSSSNPVVMWDTQTLATVKTIDVQGRPDGILFEPASGCVFVFSHSAPNVTVINAQDGSIAGTIDLGGAPEQAASDGHGRLFVDLEDKDAVAVIEVKSRQVVARYDLEKKGGTPAGLALDAKNRRLFVFCRNPATCVVLDADNGKNIATLPIGKGTDGGGFNPHTMEAFSSQGDGTLTIIKENSPTDFVVAQTVQTKARAKTCTLDAKTDRILLITTEPMPGADAPAGPEAKSAAPASKPANAKKGAGGGPALLDILVVAR
jgi:DNA-binding beta-propeller fold protein YncE